MLQPYTTDELVDAVRRDCFLANSDENWTEARILSIAHDCILEQLAPRMKNAKQNWFLTAATVTLTASVTQYDVPGEAMWNGVSSVQLRNVSSQIITGKLTLIDPNNEYVYTQESPGTPGGYWVDQTQMSVLPAPSSDVASTYDAKVV